MRGRVPPGEAMPAWATRLIGERLTEDRSASGTRSAKRRWSRRLRGTRERDGARRGRQQHPRVLRAASRERMSAARVLRAPGVPALDPDGMVQAARRRLAAFPTAPRFRTAIVPHAPYSVSPGLLRAIAGRPAIGRSACILASRPRKCEFLLDGTGPWRDLLERIGAWAPDWIPPACGPVEYVERLGLLNDRLIAVHGVQFTDDELRRLASSGATVVAARGATAGRRGGAAHQQVLRLRRPRGDRHRQPGERRRPQSVQRDGRSAPAPPEVPARQMLRSATLDGASRLGFGRDLGSVSQASARSSWPSASRPDVEDVEEYLVGGVEPSDIGWLELD